VEEIAAPYLTFDSELRLALGEETIEIWHTPPAHTDGDSVVYFRKAKVLHGGDLIWNQFVPFIDVQGGGSAKGYLTALDKIIPKVAPDAKVIPGHGKVMDVAGLKSFRQYIVDILELSAAAKRKGISREAFLKSAELPQYREFRGYQDRFKGQLRHGLRRGALSGRLTPDVFSCPVGRDCLRSNRPAPRRSHWKLPPPWLPPKAPELRRVTGAGTRMASTSPFRGS
jgi:glyoxylase-like metal-dependent hydrolase (beta-lactamase superfamily II)